MRMQNGRKIRKNIEGELLRIHAGGEHGQEKSIVPARRVTLIKIGIQH